MSKQPTTKTCSKCLKNKNIKSGFYLAASDTINSDSRLSICKPCLESVANIENTERFIDVLRQIDRPFIRSEYDASMTHNNPFGEYMRRMAMRQNRNSTYLDSEFEGQHTELEAKNHDDLDKRYNADEMISFKVTPELLLKWGDGLSESDMYQLESFYTAMSEANSITTPQHIESLKLLCKLNLGQNKALNENKVNDFKNLNMQYNVVLRDSGLRPIDQKAGGESVGIRSFSQIWEEIEHEGFIPKHEVQETQDIVDKTIMYMGNYTRRLLNSQAMASPPSDAPKVEEE